MSWEVQINMWSTKISALLSGNQMWLLLTQYNRPDSQQFGASQKT